MPRPKKRADSGGDDPEVFFDSEFDAEEFVDTMAASAGAAAQDRRPARQRLELRSEEKWLRQQLADWDDLGAEDK